MENQQMEEAAIQKTLVQKRQNNLRSHVQSKEDEKKKANSLVSDSFF